MASDHVSTAVPDAADIDGDGCQSSSVPRQSSNGRDADLKLKKFPLRQLEPFIGRFIVKLQKNVTELQQHKENLAKAHDSTVKRRLTERHPLLGEDGRVSRPTDNVTITEYEAALRSTAQLVASVRQIEQVRRQVDPLDLPTLDCRLTLVFYDVAQVLVDFLKTKDSPPKYEEQELMSDRNDADVAAAVEDRPSSESAEAGFSAADAGDNTHEPSSTCSTGTLSDRSEVVEELSLQFQQKLLDLNDQLQRLFLMIEYKTTNEVTVIPTEDQEPTNAPVHDAPSIDMFSMQERSAVIGVQRSIALDLRSSMASSSSISSLTMSSLKTTLKMMLIPVAGAVIGGALAGPVGLVAGLKVGKLAAVSGGLIGLTGGTILKKQTENVLALPPSPAEENRESSPNDLSPTSPMMNVM